MHAGLEVTVYPKSNEIQVDPSGDPAQSVIIMALTVHGTYTEFESSEYRLNPKVKVNFGNEASNTSHDLLIDRDVDLNTSLPDAQKYGLAGSISNSKCTQSDSFDFCDSIVVYGWPGLPNFEAASVDFEFLKIATGDLDQFSIEIVGSHHFDFVMATSRSVTEDGEEATSQATTSSSSAAPSVAQSNSLSSKTLPPVLAISLLGNIICVCVCILYCVCKKNRAKEGRPGDVENPADLIREHAQSDGSSRTGSNSPEHQQAETEEPVQPVQFAETAEGEESVQPDEEDRDCSLLNVSDAPFQLETCS